MTEYPNLRGGWNNDDDDEAVQESRHRGGKITGAARTRASDERRARAIELFSEGHTIPEVCAEIGVSERTYRDWRVKHKHFAVAVDAARGAKRKRRDGGVYDDDFVAWRKKYLRTETTWFQAEMIEAMLDDSAGGGSVTLVLYPPEHGKTTVIEDFCTWRLSTDKAYRITYGSESQSHSRKALRRVRNRFEYDGPFPELVTTYGPFAPVGASMGHRGSQPWGQDFFDVWGRADSDERDYSMVALGFGSQIAGSRTDLLVGDDLISMRNVGLSEKLLQTFRQDWLSRPGTKGRTVIIGTRVADGDLYDLMEDEDLPDRIVRFKAHDPQRTHIFGSPWLWPERYSEAEYAKMRKNVGESAWARNYQQAPRLAGDSTFTEPMLEACSRPLRSVLHGPQPAIRGLVLSIDPGFSHNATIALGACDDMAVILGGRDDRGLTNNQQIFAVAEELYLECSARGAKPWLHLAIEDKAFQKGLLDDEALKELQKRYGFTVGGHNTGTNKYDPNIGVPGMARDFLRQVIDLPGADDPETEKFRTLLDDQLLRWRPHVKGTALTQDMVMALWFGWLWWSRFRDALESRTNTNDVEMPGLPWAPAQLPGKMTRLPG